MFCEPLEERNMVKRRSSASSEKNIRRPPVGSYVDFWYWKFNLAYLPNGGAVASSFSSTMVSPILLKICTHMTYAVVAPTAKRATAAALKCTIFSALIERVNL